MASAEIRWRGFEHFAPGTRERKRGPEEVMERDPQAVLRGLFDGERPNDVLMIEAVQAEVVDFMKHESHEDIAPFTVPGGSEHIGGNTWSVSVEFDAKYFGIVKGRPGAVEEFFDGARALQPDVHSDIIEWFRARPVNSN
jgi:hypothetical protein